MKNICITDERHAAAVQKSILEDLELKGICDRILKIWDTAPRVPFVNDKGQVELGFSDSTNEVLKKLDEMRLDRVDLIISAYQKRNNL